MEQKYYDFVVIGGGLSGVCAAIAAARHGAKVALVQDRSMLGGNSSSEVKMHVCGADIHAYRKNARESGIIEELLLKNRFANPQHSFCVWDYTLYDAVISEPNIDLFLNARAYDVKTDGKHISSVGVMQSTTEKVFELFGKLFCDASGDGTIAYRSGAKFMYGRESKDVFDEPDAPDRSDNKVMGASLMFTAADMGRKVDFVKPDWAYTYSEEDLARRDHRRITSGYWWIEASADDIISDCESVRDELVKMLFGVWDHIKNGGDHGADNYALDFIGAYPAKRESRRFVGDYVLKEQDILSGGKFADTVAYGGWNMDLHTPNGLVNLSSAPTAYVDVPDMYGIPYRSLYSVNIDNLFLGGRLISASHLAFGSTRVMGTCAVVGQAIGAAAAMCVKKDLLPRGLCGEMTELQSTLMRDDCYLPGIEYTDELDAARSAAVSASSFKRGFEPQKVVDGHYRNSNDKNYCYRSDGIGADGEKITLKWNAPQTIDRVSLRFDSDYSSELTITISDEIRSRQRPYPSELVKKYSIALYNNGKSVYSCTVDGNVKRLAVHDTGGVGADEAVVTVYETYGAKDASLFGINAYLS